MTMDDRYDGSPYKNHVWKAVETFSQKLELFESELKMTQTAVERQDKFMLADIGRYETLIKEISNINKSVAELKENQKQSNETLEKMQKAPLVVVGFMASLSAIVMGAIQIWKHFMGSSK